MGETILIVDDEKEIADLLEVCLKNDGYTVSKFYSGTEAFRRLKNRIYIWQSRIYVARYGWAAVV